jgi:hypothetical protein
LQRHDRGTVLWRDTGAEVRYWEGAGADLGDSRDENAVI